MARFAAVLPLVAVVAFLAIQMSTALTCTSIDQCVENADSDNPDPELEQCRKTSRVCCANLKYGVADNGTTYVIDYGTCSCCGGNEECRTQQADSQGTTDNQDVDAHARLVSCQPKNE